MVVTLDKHKKISHDSKINGTDVTIGDVLAQGDTLKVGKHTFQKNCKSGNDHRCFVYKCTFGDDKKKCDVKSLHKRKKNLT